LIDLESSSWPILFFLLVAVPAEEGPITVWLKRQFGDIGAALGTGPMTLVHRALAAIVSLIHRFNVSCIL